jgi:heme A synthase
MTDAHVSQRRSLIRWPFATAVVLFFAVLVAVSFTLPDRVPLHWAADGTPDSFGTRAQFIVSFALVGLLLVALFIGVLAIANRASLARVNIPHPEYWKSEQNAPRLRVMLRADLNHLFTGVFLLLLVLLLGAAASARETSGQLDWLVPVGVVVFLLFVIGYVVYLTAVRYRVPDQAK